MIEAKKHAAFGRIFGWYNTRLLRKHFSALHVAGLENLQSFDRSLPVLFAGNHSCWWDGLVEYYLATNVFDTDIYLMMEEKQMIRYKFFRWVGAFSVNRDSPREAVASMRYAASLFSRPNRSVWIYPQGVMKPNDTRPLGFYSGVARIVQMVGRTVQIIPFARRYEFLMSQRPEVFTTIGTPIVISGGDDHRNLTSCLEKTVAILLDTLCKNIADTKLDSFETILHGTSSTNERYDAIRMK